MALYTTPSGSQPRKSYYLSQSLNHLSEQTGLTPFTIKTINLSCSQTVFNPDGNPIADVVEICMRSSTIGTNTVDLQFFYDPYDWSFPPDLMVHGLAVKPSLRDIGLDESWDHEDPANLCKVLTKLSRTIQHEERQRVAMCDNERIQVEYSCLHDSEEMDCCLIQGNDGPTKVLFASPFDVSYVHEGKKHRAKFVAKVQFLISSLVPNDVTAVQSKVEALTAFDYPDLVQSVSDIGKHESIVDFMERIKKKVTDHYEKLGRGRQLRKEFIEELISTFRYALLECDIVDYKFATFLFTVPKDRTRSDSAVAAFYVSESFPDEYPKLTLTSTAMPVNSYTPTPPPEVVPLVRYSPRWPAERIVKEIWEQLWEEIPRYSTKMT
ncbi:hypothetical protein B0O80DRAFT_487221 [Mortierella sp. GBAus27b]|nr:hypothetical protein B0O80DRAFT_487221 [Mortierella sp. GBAus27b]